MKSYITVVLLLVSIVSFAQNKSVIWNDDFSTDKAWSFEGSWERDVATAGGSQNGDPEYDHTPTSDNMLIGTNIGGDYNNNENVSAISPVIDCSSFSEVNLSFFSFSQMENNWDEFFVEISTDGTNWTDVTENYYPNETDWTFHIINITAIAANQPTVQIRFRIESDYSTAFPGVSIDDVVLKTFDQYDFAISSISPNSALDDYFGFVPQIEVNNYGSEISADFSIRISIEQEGLEIFCDTTDFNFELNTFQNRKLYLNKVNLQAGNYDVFCELIDQDDQNADNNFMTINLIVSEFISYSYFGNKAIIFNSDVGNLDLLDYNIDEVHSIMSENTYDIENINGIIYIIDQYNLYSLNGDNTVRFIGRVAPENHITRSITYDQDNDIIYLVTMDEENNNDARPVLHKINSENLEIETIGFMNNPHFWIAAIEYANGNLYAVTQLTAGSYPGLYSVNPQTAEMTLINQNSAPIIYFTAGLTYNQNDDKMYLLSYNWGDGYSTFSEVDLSNGGAFLTLETLQGEYWTGLEMLGDGLEIVEYYPTDNQNGVPVNQQIEIEFSTTPIANNLDKIVVIDELNDTLQNITSYIQDKSLIIEHPNFETATEYTVRVPSGVIKSANYITNLNFEWSFITQQFTEITENDKNIKIYPNPSNGSFNIKSDSKIVIVEIYDITGKLHMETAENHINISEKGVYIAKIYNINNETYSRKIIVQ